MEKPQNFSKSNNLHIGEEIVIFQNPHRLYARNFSKSYGHLLENEEGGGEWEIFDLGDGVMQE